MLIFDEYGFLKPYEPIKIDLDMLEHVFVREFANSITRQTIFEQYRAYTDRLLTLLPGGFTQWIDGSFVSRKLDPNDIDVLTFIDADLYSRHERALKELKNEFAQGAGRVDVHFIRIYAEGHRYRPHFESDRVQWLFDWSRTNTRPRRNKGFLELIVC
ncbi:DUF6932 family protein [Spirosoma montaniterrae]|uniref:Polymerase nucleotidyl transferase domain-containing protein n=1 Tax=Spirosoma montaniterrae TaxID=1178516 RepID=A0A1P9WTF1_9BACT|nr:hypothetical protein [Spirosoma montaniterrae]AQG78620.1 hypothetical protein AWR27_04270 [Spirosoma montaniterrae]